ncbi:Gpi18-like mannosyltransferase [Allocatelliglobosispora scoriae]|uniref:Gpi18-like mannosyltransferase n=1 Tax=Allocatelliglobosispora scoriae TaxID=643052 RepID=A0A841BJ49_9ACTN|nr:mannosyltransferase family protein [Allocatelliglobosispora scoriae]MBB5867645.1 Gpi18-like mannosyltransferase [Allocatelliglobosispora scoriae]
MAEPTLSAPEPASAEPAPAEAGAWLQWRPSLITGVSTWAAAFAACVLLSAVSWLPYQDLPAKAGDPSTSVSSFFDLWHRWDTTWYLLIADVGYHADDRAAAFFPLYPMLVRGIAPLVPDNTIVAALLVSSLATIAALTVIHRLTVGALGEDDARRTVFYLMAFPTAFYLLAAYNESLFIALAAGSLYCMRRGQWWWAGLLAGFASATRLAGVLLGLAFAYEYLRQAGFSWRRIRWNVLAAVLVPGGLFAYMAYCAAELGNPTAFLKAQEAWSRAEFEWPWTTAGKIFEMLGSTNSYLHPDDIRNIANLTAAVVTLTLLVLALVGPWKLGHEYAYLVIFATMVVLLPLTHPLATYYPLSSLWRYVLECIPAFMVLGRMGRNPHLHRVYVFCALMLQGAMIISFVQNQFVA